MLTRSVRCTHRESCLTDRKTEPSSPLRPPIPERTNTNRSLNMQTEKDVKEPTSAPTRSVLCAQGPRRETRLKALEHQIWHFLLLYWQIHTNYVKKLILVSRSVSWLTTRGRQTHTHHMDFILNSISHHAHWLHTHLFSITWTLFKPFWPSILGSLLLYLTAITKKITHCSWLNYILVLTIINPQSNQKIFRHQIQFFDIRLLVGAGQYTL